MRRERRDEWCEGGGGGSWEEGVSLGSIVIAGCCRTISETGSANARRFKSKSSCTSVSGKGNETSAPVTTEVCQIKIFSRVRA